MTKRRVKGEGSVYRRGDGRVVGEYEDANGKRRYIAGKTKAEVRTKLRKLLSERDTGIAYDSGNLTTGEYLDKWLYAVRDTVRQRTWQRHEEVVRLHLKPHLGNAKLHLSQVLATTNNKMEAKNVTAVSITSHMAKVSVSAAILLRPASIVSIVTPQRELNTVSPKAINARTVNSVLRFRSFRSASVNTANAEATVAKCLKKSM